MPKTTITIINYNGKNLLNKCLQSLLHQSAENFDIVIVDNGSTDSSIEDIENNFISSDTGLKIIQLERNTGFAGGNIEGLKHSNGTYVALVNNDTETDKNWLSELILGMENDSTIGICASKMISYGIDIIDTAGDGFSTVLKGFKRGEGEDPRRYEKKEYVFGACAGAALYRREMLDEIGFFDEDFFLIYEDTDLNFRAQLAGWKVMYVPDAIVHHKVRSSIGEMSDIAVYYSLRNSELVRIKNVPFGIFLRCLPWFLISEISEFIYFVLKHRRFLLYFRAKKDALKLFPKMLKKRKEIMKNKKVSNQYIMSMMTPVWEKDFFLTKIRKFFRG